jgi:mannose-1-phosphate guanylyltransferase
MLPVAGRPMIERVLAHLAAHGVDEVILSLGYRPDAFTAAFRDGCCAGVRLRYAVEPEPRDTAGGIAFAARAAGIDETFVVQNGDVLTGLDVTALVEFHKGRGGAASLSLTPVEDPSRYGVVATDLDGRVTAFVEKPEPGTETTNLINAGTYVLEPDVVDGIARDGPVSIERQVFPALAVKGSLFALASTADWVDAGTILTYLDANLALAQREQRWVDAAADVDPTATVIGSIIAAGVVVGAGALVERSLVMTGARIGRSAVIRDSIIGTGAVVGDRSVIEKLSVVGDGVSVATGWCASGTLFPDGVS